MVDLTSTTTWLVAGLGAFMTGLVVLVNIMMNAASGW